jgi:molybdopterin-guanine dinucleotide biosynthesis protein A
VLTWLAEEWALVVACDQPFLAPELLRGLIEQPRAGVDAVVGRPTERQDPLPGLYRKTCLPVVERMLSHGDRDLKALLGSVRLREVPIELLREWDPRLHSYMNVNTLEELTRARALAAAAGGERHDS